MFRVASRAIYQGVPSSTQKHSRLRTSQLEAIGAQISGTSQPLDKLSSVSNTALISKVSQVHSECLYRLLALSDIFEILLPAVLQGFTRGAQDWQRDRCSPFQIGGTGLLRLHTSNSTMQLVCAAPVNFDS